MYSPQACLQPARMGTQMWRKRSNRCTLASKAGGALIWGVGVGVGGGVWGVGQEVGTERADHGFVTQAAKHGLNGN